MCVSQFSHFLLSVSTYFAMSWLAVTSTNVTDQKGTRFTYCTYLNICNLKTKSTVNIYLLAIYVVICQRGCRALILY